MKFFWFKDSGCLGPLLTGSFGYFVEGWELSFAGFEQIEVAIAKSVQEISTEWTPKKPEYLIALYSNLPIGVY